MFLACGVAAYSAGIFHLLTHAFFKALLFLAAGSVIHALSGEQDMRNMGGLRKKIPITFWTMTAAVFAISGVLPFAGFFCKDEILYQAFLSPNGGKIFWAVGLLTAGLTSFYMFRLWFKTFFGDRRTSEAAHEEDLAASPRTLGHEAHSRSRARIRSWCTPRPRKPVGHARPPRCPRHPLGHRWLYGMAAKASAAATGSRTSSSLRSKPST